MANADANDPDPEVDEVIKAALLDPEKNNNFGTHSLRRKSDKGVRDYFRKKGELREAKEKINQHFGWDQANMEKDMQCRYDAADLNNRLDTAEMTADM